LKLAISTLKLKVEKSSTVTAYTATLERIGGAASATSSSATTTSLVTFAGLSGADYLVNPGEVAYFLVKVTPTVSSSFAGDSNLKLGFGALDSSDFTWTDATTDSSASKTTLRLPKTTVDGYLISN